MADRHPTSHRTESPGKSGVRSKQPDAGKQLWHAVTIVTPGHACDAASSLKGHRFLAREAPRLPLEACPSPEYCRCTYRHFTDRRSGPRRGSERGELTRIPKSGERRSNRGRRASDNEED